MSLQQLTRSLLFASLISFCGSCAFRNVTKTKDLPYSSSNSSSQKLNIFSSNKRAELSPVLIFIHGGNWNSGNKSLYGYLGKRLAKKGIVTVVIGYPYHPDANYEVMAQACAEATLWVEKNIEKYGGNPKKIYVAGHSAGGHLAALISLNPQYFKELGIDNPIKGAVLIDAAGLDMAEYLKKEKLPVSHHYFQVFGKNSEMWKKATPLYYVRESNPQFLIYQGEKTYSSIKDSNRKFVDALDKSKEKAAFKIVKGKRHVAMITQFFDSDNPMYSEIINFMK